MQGVALHITPRKIPLTDTQNRKYTMLYSSSKATEICSSGTLSLHILSYIVLYCTTAYVTQSDKKGLINREYRCSISVDAITILQISVKFP